MKGKKVIKKVAKTTCKYTLKGLGKGIELTGRGAVKGANALIRNPKTRKLMTTAGILTAGVMIPAVGAGLIGAVGLKYMIDKSILNTKIGGKNGRDKGLLDEVKDILRAGDKVTEKVGKYVLSPLLSEADMGLAKAGQKYQDIVDQNQRLN